MKRNLIGVLSLVVLSLLLNATGAYAQSQVRANVPFAFKVGKAQLPSGSYQIMKNTENNTITIANRGGGAVSLVQAAYSGDRTPRLVFHHIGNQYFLSQIWGAGDSGMTLPTSKLEEELQLAAGGSSKSETVTVALK